MKDFNDDFNEDEFDDNDDEFDANELLNFDNKKQQPQYKPEPKPLQQSSLYPTKTNTT